jgi:hypothetical protein
MKTIVDITLSGGEVVLVYTNVAVASDAESVINIAKKTSGRIYLLYQEVKYAN